ncbi:SH3 domain protein-like protein [Angomonas deanei]|uniref:Variant SH3 domain/SH3 domain containing protein, putative n=1 Tax=Angomonas deanei TaxID=59799 RepID=A0A7G2CDS6_9TRYP|nr:SH3 domain protein-like protein [Angomonas deanei]CAD2218000.1 Variant SH3 domain/SH3 domain containing protein, putative [Angomonas deanei]|eukprot:EPY43066.1 SH3 domain protein-like protein [Angomonas deanei]
MSTFRVSHDFNGVESVEISAQKGEIVKAVDNVVQDGWVKVSVMGDPSRKGFIPLSYLKEIESTNSPDRDRPEEQTYTPSRPKTGSPAAAVNKSITPAQEGAGPVSSLVLSNPNTVVDAFMKNELYFKQLMRQKSEAMSAIQSCLEDAMTEVAACKDKNATLSRKLIDLSQLIDHERQRWVERVDEERQFVSRSVQHSQRDFVRVSPVSTPSRQTKSY